jgi:archaellin
MRRVSIFAICLTICFLPPCWATDTVRYVDVAASGGGNGLKETPWLPVEIPWDSFLAGTDDTYLYFFGGTYTSKLTIEHASATNRLYIKPCSASPSPSGCSTGVVFSVSGATSIAVAGRNVTIDGETTSGSGTRNVSMDLSSVADSGRAIEFGGTGANYVNNTLRYIEFYGMTDTLYSQTKKIIYAPIVDGTEISYNYFHDNQGLCEIQATSYTADYSKVLIHHNTALRITINFLSGGQGVDLYNNTIDATDSQEEYDILHYYTTSSQNYFRVYNNYLKSNDQMIYLQNSSSSSCQDGHACPIEYIRIFNNVFDTADVGEGPAILMEMHETGYIDDIVIANNTFINKKFAFVIVCSPDKSCVIGNTTPFKIENNIFYENCVGEITGIDGNATWRTEEAFVFDYNNLYCSSDFRWSLRVAPNGAVKQYTSVSTWNTDHTTQNHNISTNPLLSGYNILSTSPAINAGADLSSYFTADIIGTARPQNGAWDIGAYEYFTTGAFTGSMN